MVKGVNMKALIHNNLVVDISENGFVVHPSMSWVDIPAGVEISVGWSYKGGVFALPQADRGDLTTAATEAINAWRTAQEIGGILFNEHVFDTDKDSRERIAAAKISGVNPLGYWTSAANVDVPMTYDDVKGLYAAITLAGAEIHARQRVMKLALPGMTDAELQAFVPGWDVAPNWLPPQ